MQKYFSVVTCIRVKITKKLHKGEEPDTSKTSTWNYFIFYFSRIRKNWKTGKTRVIKFSGMAAHGRTSRGPVTPYTHMDPALADDAAGESPLNSLKNYGPESLV